MTITVNGAAAAITMKTIAVVPSRPVSVRAAVAGGAAAEEALVVMSVRRPSLQKRIDCYCRRSSWSHPLAVVLPIGKNCAITNEKACVNHSHFAQQ